MLYRTACGCIVLITDTTSPDRRHWKGRIIEHCGGDDNGRNYRIAPEAEMAPHFFDLEKMEPLPKVKQDAIFASLAKLVLDGYRFREIAEALRSAIQEPNES